MVKYSVNQETCIGCESCTAMCPDLFEMHDGKSIPKKKDLAENEVGPAKQAEQACPVNAIKVEG